ncbi:MAG TPA: hypothetical protein DHW71_00350 [Gammaproteobacteria bacterium]|nr:hypothetical protein [Gammaproteobacteria bacterium]HBF07277.1 hypothetical protein [Gammaproteobacteria bacterium]HCK91399.1 hypothetical protein [Gammaproteobacteria bacterium]|tara:strand:+ start:29917 stop:30834 length:918 start_codon:yes stop_codon:yes gene_type:complete
MLEKKRFISLSCLALLTACGSDSDSFSGIVEADNGNWFYQEDFESEPSGWYERIYTGGEVEYGYNDTTRGLDSTLRLLFPGDPLLEPADKTSPTYATEAVRIEYSHYGRYEFSVNFAECTSGEEVVNGVFVYNRTGDDDNQNGIGDSSEIDIEVLCGEPQVLWLSVWTDYEYDSNTQTESFRKKTRAINMLTGSYIQTPEGGEGSYNNEQAGQLDFQVLDFPNSNVYYHLGFEWHEDSVRWFMIHDGQERTLWHMTDVDMVPQDPAQIMFNVWHTATHWYSGGEADYPASDAEMKVDFVRYQPVE